jgi:hypothetical protein
VGAGKRRSAAAQLAGDWPRLTATCATTSRWTGGPDPSRQARRWSTLRAARRPLRSSTTPTSAHGLATASAAGPRPRPRDRPLQHRDARSARSETAYAPPAPRRPRRSGTSAAPASASRREIAAGWASTRLPEPASRRAAVPRARPGPAAGQRPGRAALRAVRARGQPPGHPGIGEPGPANRCTANRSAARPGPDRGRAAVRDPPRAPAQVGIHRLQSAGGKTPAAGPPRGVPPACPLPARRHRIKATISAATTASYPDPSTASARASAPPGTHPRPARKHPDADAAGRPPATRRYRPTRAPGQPFAAGRRQRLGRTAGCRQ